MGHLIVDEMQEQWRDPLMILSFSGWNDAAESATAAAEFLVQCWAGKRFASIEAEEFFHFSLHRPTVRFLQGSEWEREIIWPNFHFHLTQASDLPRDVIIGIGAEPHLRWKTFCQVVLDLIQKCQVSMVITLGAFLADVSHTRPIRVSGVTTDQDLASRLRTTATRYEGPTGITGVLNDSCRRAGLKVISLWAQIPHYISEVRNPNAMLALIRRILTLLDWEANLSTLEDSARRFDSQLEEIVSQNPNVAQYLRQLEQREEEANKGEGGREEDLELPPTSELIKEIEQFLRQHRRESTN